MYVYACSCVCVCVCVCVFILCVCVFCVLHVCVYIWFPPPPPPQYYRLQLFQRFEKFWVIVFGGDGSIGWVLSTLDKLNLHHKVHIHTYVCTYHIRKLCIIIRGGNKASELPGHHDNTDQTLVLSCREYNNNNMLKFDQTSQGNGWKMSSDHAAVISTPAYHACSCPGFHKWRWLIVVSNYCFSVQCARIRSDRYPQLLMPNSIQTVRKRKKNWMLTL